MKRESKYEELKYHATIGRITKTLVKILSKEKPLFCEICQREKNLEIHHMDYGDPLNILYLCRSCHKLLHAIIKEKQEK